MKILTRKQFLALRGEYVYAKYKPSYFYDFGIKMCNSGPDDYCHLDLVENIEASSSDKYHDKLTEAEENPGEVSLSLDFENGGRDGMFDDDQLFAIWEDADVQAMINRLQQVLDKTNKYESN